MWPETVLTGCYLINRLPSSVFNGKCPFELIFGYDPNIFHLRSFGSLCFAKKLTRTDNFREKYEKCHEKYDKCVMIGYSNGQKAYKLYILESKSVVYSRYVMLIMSTYTLFL